MKRAVLFLLLVVTASASAQWSKIQETAIAPGSATYLGEFGLMAASGSTGGVALDSAKLYIGANHLANVRIFFCPVGWGHTKDPADSVGGFWYAQTDSVSGGSTMYSFIELQRLISTYANLHARYAVYGNIIAAGSALASQSKKLYLYQLNYSHPTR